MRIFPFNQQEQWMQNTIFSFFFTIKIYGNSTFLTIGRDETPRAGVSKKNHPSLSADFKINSDPKARVVLLDIIDNYR